MNARNAAIAELNSRRSILEARDKLLTKRRLEANDVPVTPTLAVLDSPRRARRFDWGRLPERFVMKPARGSQGRGVLLVDETSDPRELRRRALEIIDGHHSGDDDVALIEPLLVSDPELADLAPIGLPDVRIVCVRGRPLMAMLRIPTVDSGGAGNLHRGGLGAAIDLRSGVVTHVMHRGREVVRHPDTGSSVVGRRVPEWTRLIDLARRAGQPTGLGYLGVDLVVDESLGAVVLEVNSHPGLEIQNVNRRSLLESW